jgi:hypothetical protein
MVTALLMARPMAFNTIVLEDRVDDDVEEEEVDPSAYLQKKRSNKEVW